MKSLFKTISFYTGMFIWILISIAVLGISWSMSTTNIVLDKTPKTRDTVLSLGRQATSTSRGSVNSFVITLKNERTGYWIYRSDGDYQPFINSIQIGSVVTVYHSPMPESNGYYSVYQLQNESGMIYSKEEYERKEKLAGRFIGIPGGIVLLGAVFVQIRKRRKQNTLSDQ